MKGFIKKKTIKAMNVHGELVDMAVLVGEDEKAIKYINNRKDEQVLSMDIKQVRNYENHKRFFSMLNAAFDLQEFYSSVEAFRSWMIVSAGWFNIMVYPDGTTQLYPKSMSFENLDELEFRELFKSAVNAFLEEFGHGMSDAEFMKIIEYD